MGLELESVDETTPLDPNPPALSLLLLEPELPVNEKEFKSN
jgi:hypothetical protein